MEKLWPLLVGGSVGTVCRFWVATWAIQKTAHMEYGSVAVNLIGCFLIGLIAGLPEGATSLSPTMRLLLMTGFLGGFTTFSAYEYDSFLLVKDGMLWRAMLNLGGSVILGFIAVCIGYTLAQGVLKAIRGH